MFRTFTVFFLVQSLKSEHWIECHKPNSEKKFVYLQGSLIKLLNYKASDSQSPFDKGICLDSKGLDARVSVLQEACEGDRTLLTQVESLQRLATVAQ